MTRDEAYQALADLITKGFLSVGMEAAGKFMVFKTINEKEFQIIKMLAGIQGPEYAARFNTWFLVYSLLLFDGEHILIDREKRGPDLYQFFDKMSGKACNRIFTELSDMRAQAYDAVKYIEGFSYTYQSRHMWRELIGSSPDLEQYTGFPGTSKLGLNAHQESWILINRALDDEEIYSREFSMAVLITSATNHKGARQLRAKHDADVQTTADKRKRLSIEGYIDTKARWRPEGWAAPVDTAEELLAELERQMTGQKDKHDLFIEGYLKSLKDNADKRAEEAQERIRLAHEKSKDLPDFDGESRPATPQEMAELRSRKKSIGGIEQVSGDNAVSPEEKERFINKIGSKVLTARK